MYVVTLEGFGETAGSAVYVPLPCARTEGRAERKAEAAKGREKGLIFMIEAEIRLIWLAVKQKLDTYMAAIQIFIYGKRTAAVRMRTKGFHGFISRPRARARVEIL